MKKFGSIICSALLLLGLTVGSSAVANAAQPSMTVTFIDCDQGDSILVESNGHRMLVDGGKAVHAQAVEDCLRSKSIHHTRPTQSATRIISLLSRMNPVAKRRTRLRIPGFR